DPDAWVNGFLAALEEAGLLRPDDQAPAIRTEPKVVSLLATLASGVLAGPAGSQILTNGDVVDFFTHLRSWYGSSATLPDDLQLSHPTHTERFNVYVPFDDNHGGSAHPEILPGTSPPPNFQRFLTVAGTQNP